jgi:hypothetical protein
MTTLSWLFLFPFSVAALSGIGVLMLFGVFFGVSYVYFFYFVIE